jgi:hypothetical protein
LVEKFLKRENYMNDETLLKIGQISSHIHHMAGDITKFFKLIYSDIPEDYVKIHNLYVMDYNTAQENLSFYLKKGQEGRDLEKIAELYAAIETVVEKHYDYIRKLADDFVEKSFEITD